MRERRISFLLMTALALAGCGISEPDSNTTVRAELVRLPGESATAPVATTAVGPASSAPALAPPPAGVTSDVTVTSLRIPITAVDLRGSGGTGFLLYACTPGPDEDCLVELNGPELENLIATSEVTVEPGTYDQVAVGYCSEPGQEEWDALVTAEARFGGTTYYSRTGLGLDDTGPAEALALPTHGCGSGFPIRPPLIVDAETDARVVLRLFFDIRDIAYAGSASPAHVGFSCSPVADPAVTPYLCTAYPTVVATYDGLLPVVERYRINGSATIGLNFQGSSGSFIEAYVRRYFTPDEEWNPGFTPDAFFSTFIDNGDGTYRLERDDVTFPNFRRETHSGTMDTADLGPVPYTAVLLR
ncbi:MAG TPA: hypothetical protein VK858_01080 [Longimicrobiales bacterium]|nr:hypothetical protein [Longimicrobiales bacterium]